MVLALTVAVSLLASFAAAANIAVTVSPGGEFTYDPQSVAAAVGDMVTFTFPGGLQHSVSQSTTQSPCVPMAGGFTTGLVDSTTKTLTVTSTDPMYFMCEQAGHCTFGMVFTINTPDSGPGSFMDFQQAATSGTSAGVAPAAGGSSNSNSASSTTTPASKSATNNSASKSSPSSPAASTPSTSPSNTPKPGSAERAVARFLPALAFAAVAMALFV